MYPGGDRAARSTSGRVGESHHPDCPRPFGECWCQPLWEADRARHDDLDIAYAQFYDPDWDN